MKRLKHSKCINGRTNKKETFDRFALKHKPAVSENVVAVVRQDTQALRESKYVATTACL